MSERNIELLTRIRDLVALTPDKLEMGSWATVAEDIVQFEDGTSAKVSCGTTACIAGWAVQLSGYLLLVDEDNFDRDGYYAVFCAAGDNRPQMIDDKARELLGLTVAEADFLFLDVENSEAVTALNAFIAGKDLKEIQEEVFGGEIYNPEEQVPF